MEFILNNQKIVTDKSNGVSLLDYIRKDAHLIGTKIGCREGDCGACTVLVGSLINNTLVYKSIVSCLTPLVNVQGKHIVTIEGINLENLSPVQKAISNNSATQCGFCTPGFVISLTAHLLSANSSNSKMAISGNICRCTGYKSIEKAADEVDNLKDTLLKGSEIDLMIEKGWLPEYFATIEGRLRELDIEKHKPNSTFLIGGGTDIMVQKLEMIRNSRLESSEYLIPSNIIIDAEEIQIGAGINMSDFFNNHIIKSSFPALKKFSYLIASEQIRNMATLAGNIVNASPIGDLSIIFIALNADLIIENKLTKTRRIKLADFFKDYKKTELQNKEVIKFIILDSSITEGKFNFEKVSKRTYLDIASVNTALSIKIHDDIIKDVLFSAGGVAPFPILLKNTISFLKGKKLNIDLLNKSIDILLKEISPISDIRGSKEYKSLLLKQLFIQHFVKLFPFYFTNSDIHKLLITNTLHHEKY